MIPAIGEWKQRTILTERSEVSKFPKAKRVIRDDEGEFAQRSEVSKFPKAKHDTDDGDHNSAW